MKNPKERSTAILVGVAAGAILMALMFMIVFGFHTGIAGVVSHERTFERLLNIFQASFFKFLFKSGFCILYEKILRFVRKATTEGQSLLPE